MVLMLMISSSSCSLYKKKEACAKINYIIIVLFLICFLSEVVEVVANRLLEHLYLFPIFMKYKIIYNLDVIFLNEFMSIL